MCMLDPKELTLGEKCTIEQLMRDVPLYKQRIAGKSLPMEKFACKRAERYFLTGTLIIPAIGNIFSSIMWLPLLTSPFILRIDVFVELVQNYWETFSHR